MIEEGSKFPDFSLPDQDGNILSLSDLKGKEFVIYFYPKDDTPGCTAEACDFRDRADSLGKKLIGVSPDPVKSHKKFAEKYELPFTLLADTEKTLCEAVGVWVEKSMYGKTYMGVERSTFVVGADGVVKKVYRKVKVPGHVESIAKDIS
ncbi:hypothetical protein BH11ARM1_BH11ARM1_14780 [soil metagenome]